MKEKVDSSSSQCMLGEGQNGQHRHHSYRRQIAEFRPKANGSAYIRLQLIDSRGFPVLRLTFLKSEQIDPSERRVGAWNSRGGESVLRRARRLRFARKRLVSRPAWWVSGFGRVFGHAYPESELGKRSWHHGPQITPINTDSPLAMKGGGTR
jgi:hypothetical protein